MAVYDIDDCIFKFVYVAAMRDAVNQGAYTGDREWLWSEYDKKGNLINCNSKLINSLKDYLKTHINAIIGGSFENQEEYDLVFCHIAFLICKAINDCKTNNHKDSGPFEFGNAQKLINMTVKYFYIAAYGNNRELRERFKYCHCPVDEKMISRVWTEKSKSDKKRNNAKFINYEGGKEFSREDFLIGWSNLKEDENIDVENYTLKEDGWYHSFQELVREIIRDRTNTKGDPIIPIEYDYIFWKQ
ncbi:MAG: hypothetical protein IKN38_01925 [Clostridia bacterium]|nr:hypothetical protein [Clostridia bacterium]